MDNLETLKGHEGRYVRVQAHVYVDEDSIHITEVKMPTASESGKNDMRRARLMTQWAARPDTKQRIGMDRNKMRQNKP